MKKLKIGEPMENELLTPIRELTQEETELLYKMDLPVSVEEKVRRLWMSKKPVSFDSGLLSIAKYILPIFLGLPLFTSHPLVLNLASFALWAQIIICLLVIPVVLLLFVSGIAVKSIPAEAKLDEQVKSSEEKFRQSMLSQSTLVAIRPKSKPQKAKSFLLQSAMLMVLVLGGHFVTATFTLIVYVLFFVSTVWKREKVYTIFEEMKEEDSNTRRHYFN